jgi:hypothetical protein
MNTPVLLLLLNTLYLTYPKMLNNAVIRWNAAKACPAPLTTECLLFLEYASPNRSEIISRWRRYYAYIRRLQGLLTKCSNNCTYIVNSLINAPTYIRVSTRTTLEELNILSFHTPLRRIHASSSPAQYGHKLKPLMYERQKVGLFDQKMTDVYVTIIKPDEYLRAVLDLYKKEGKP